jgi:magnesium transporter
MSAMNRMEPKKPAMGPARPRLVIDSARRILRHGAYRKVAHLMEGMRPGDAAAFFESIPLDDRRKLVKLLRRESVVNLLGALTVEVAAETFSDMEEAEIVGLLGQIPREDAAAVLRFLDAGRREELLARMDAAASGEVEELLAYPAGSVGAIMKPEVFALEESASIGEAIEALQLSGGQGSIFYVYITDRREFLVGVVSFRMLLLAPRETPLREIMKSDVNSVRATEPAGEAAALIERYDLVALPVVDEDHRLLGVVTVDDIVDLIQERATQELYKMAGLGSDDRVFSPPSRSIKKRLPWLFVNLLTAFLAASVVNIFETTIKTAAVLAVLMPIVAGMGGNAATQTLTVVIRGLVVGEVTVRDAFRAVMKEGAVNLAIGCILGCFMALTAYIWKGNVVLGLVLGTAMVCNMLVAGIAGALIPLSLRVLKIDPALASGVIVTTFTDCCGFFSFLGLATLLLRFMPA